GGSWNGASTPTTSNLAYAGGAGAYIELDLGSVQNIDGISLWGRTDYANESNNLRVFVSNTAFARTDTYASLSANTGMARVDVGAVTGNAADQYVDTVTSVENVVGTALDDTLTGDTNSNFLCGGDGNDTYRLAKGGNSDVISDTGGNDRLIVDAGIDATQLWLRKVNSGADLEVSCIGTNDRVTIKDWYAKPAAMVEQLQLANGKVLTQTGVDQLVNAMAAFAPPPTGQITLTQTMVSQLQPSIVSAWH
ncbi:calcium-binding protein, partial [Ralstonia sp. 1138]|uniref:calcium-binding protein n=1 Tax=Ralstonia sp. 1138 TaxID=3156423 RepID=UPI00339577BC